MEIDYDDIIYKMAQRITQPNNTNILFNEKWKCSDNQREDKNIMQAIEKLKNERPLLYKSLCDVNITIKCGAWLDGTKKDIRKKEVYDMAVNCLVVLKVNDIEGKFLANEILRYICMDCDYLSKFPGNNHDPCCPQYEHFNYCESCHTAVKKVSYTKCRLATICYDCVKLQGMEIHELNCDTCKCICSFCNTIHAQHLTKCNRCLIMRYCDRNCQIAGWKINGHSAKCMPLN